MLQVTFTAVTSIATIGLCECPAVLAEGSLWQRCACMWACERARAGSATGAPPTWVAGSLPPPPPLCRHLLRHADCDAPLPGEPDLPLLAPPPFWGGGWGPKGGGGSSSCKATAEGGLAGRPCHLICPKPQTLRPDLP